MNRKNVEINVSINPINESQKHQDKISSLPFNRENTLSITNIIRFAPYNVA